MRISRDKDGVELKMSHAEFSNLHSFMRMGVELAANQVFQGLPDFLADGPVIEEDKIPQFGAPWAAEEETVNESKSQEVWSARQHENHSRRLDWLEGMYRSLEKRVKIAENDLDSIQGEEANHTSQTMANFKDRLHGYENQWSRTVTELKERMSKLENRFNPVEGRGSAGPSVVVSDLGQGGAGWGRAGSVTGFGGGGGAGEANAALNFASMSGRLADPLHQAEARVRDYMKTNFSAATILGVVDAIRGE
jgi:hypothetical protein